MAGRELGPYCAKLRTPRNAVTRNTTPADRAEPDVETAVPSTAPNTQSTGKASPPNQTQNAHTARICRNSHSAHNATSADVESQRVFQSGPKSRTTSHAAVLRPTNSAAPSTQLSAQTERRSRVHEKAVILNAETYPRPT